MQRLSLAQQIAQLEDVAPVDLDPEDIEVTGINPDSDIDISADNNDARAHYFDVGPSSLRKLHDGFSDPKYDGAKTSREQIHDEFDNSESDSASEDPQSGSYASKVSETRDFDEENGLTRGLDITDASAEHPGPKQHNDMSSSLSKIREDDRKKGRAISRQIALWDSLLDARIRLQKSVAAGNRLPPASIHPSLFEICLMNKQQEASSEHVQTALMKMLGEARLLSNEIFEFQERLLSENESILHPPRKRRKGSETDYTVTDYTDEFREASLATSELEYAYHTHLVQTLSKWSSKIQAVAPSVLLPSNRNAFSKTSQHIKSATQLIDETLVDHSKVLARTRIYRGKGSRLGDRDTEEDGNREKEDPEVFDDIDFYHQLLRDIIDTRGNEIGGNGDWMAMQKEKKGKKKVDTKASKGRKLRYEVHEKIQNFMVPVPTQMSWHEEQIDELFASLLGKGFETAMQEVGETADERLQEEVTAALQGGFRVFG